MDRRAEVARNALPGGFLDVWSPSSTKGNDGHAGLGAGGRRLGGHDDDGGYRADPCPHVEEDSGGCKVGAGGVSASSQRRCNPSERMRQCGRKLRQQVLILREAVNDDYDGFGIKA